MAQYRRPDAGAQVQSNGFDDDEYNDFTDWTPDVSGVNFGQLTQSPLLAHPGVGDGSELRTYYPSPRERLAIQSALPSLVFEAGAKLSLRYRLNGKGQSVSHPSGPTVRSLKELGARPLQQVTSS